MTRQTSIQLTEATEQQIAALRAQGYGNTTNVIRTAIDRMAREEGSKTMKANARAIVTVWKPTTTATGGPDVTTEEEIRIERWEYNQAPWYGDVARCIAERSSGTMRFVRWVD